MATQSHRVKQMREHSEHTAFVDTWVDGLPGSLGPAQLVLAFEQGFTAVWQRAQRTLGEVTVSAIGERVLFDVSREVPLLAALKVARGNGVQFDELRRQVKPEDVEGLREGMRSTLIQFLTVMGHLTADILSPALHGELSSVRVQDLSGVEGLSTNGKHPPQKASGRDREPEGRTR